MVETSMKIYDGIEVRAQKPLDVRSTVTYREDLYNINSWPHDSYVDEQGVEHHTIYMKEGMMVVVTGDETTPVFELYVLTNLSKILNSDYSGWKYIGGAGSGQGGASLFPGGGMPFSGNIDGGRADAVYAPTQVLYCGNASTRGEIENESIEE